ncbi:hypothetical protein [Bacillus sp. 165]|uniref:hypothetical protein n=1 Tax=Bacillus sp. 165 TaxID=1529117 RepID=UPI001ADD4C93|nr:hypothetical protein [Bacillus sp. 165]MBO9128628.1 hypothetical protein [Bacillus sp. 165]
MSQEQDKNKPEDVQATSAIASFIVKSMMLKHNIKTDEIKKTLTEEQKKELKDMFQQLEKQVNSFVESTKNKETETKKKKRN